MGKSLDEKYGKERADEIKNKISNTLKKRTDLGKINTFTQNQYQERQWGPFINHQLICENPECDKEFSVREREKKEPKQRFCSKSCSRSYSSIKNKDSKNKKISKILTKQKYCKYCSCEIDNKISCNECKKWYQSISVFQKLGLKIHNRKLNRVAEEALDIFKYYYFDLEYSTLDIGKKFNISNKTIDNFFKKFNINLRGWKNCSKVSWKKGKNKNSVGIINIKMAIISLGMVGRFITEAVMN